VAAEMERLQTWQAHEDRQAERFAAYLTTVLRPYDDQLRTEGKVSARHKGYRLPHGTLTTRQAPIEWEVDETTLLAWAEATDPETLVRVTKAPAWNVIKPQLIPARDVPRAEAAMVVIDTRTGEVWVVPVPGVWVKAGPREVFTTKPALACGSRKLIATSIRQMSTRVITRLAAHRDDATHLLLALPGAGPPPAVGPAAAAGNPWLTPGACPSDDHQTRHPRPEQTIGRREARSRYRPLVDRSYPPGPPPALTAPASCGTRHAQARRAASVGGTWPSAAMIATRSCHSSWRSSERPGAAASPIPAVAGPMPTASTPAAQASCGLS
jgi:Bacteriophage Mu Gam like protein